MLLFFRRLVLVLLLAAITAVLLLVCLSPDPMYAVQELVACGRYSDYDGLIAETAQKRGMNPTLLKAVVWRESAFVPDKNGSRGERGLMQVSEAAATDWAKASKIETFVPTDLFEPRTNLDAGAWYLARALDKWKDKDKPEAFALAEYNAGGSRMERWIAASGADGHADAHDLLAAIDFPATRKYVEDILARSEFYRARGGK